MHFYERFRQPNEEKKVVVFDMDETIGSFREFTSLLQYIKIYQNKILTQEEFNKLLDLYPEFLRTDIIHVFKYLLKKKKKRECYKIYIYTNNVYSPEFPNYIRNYIEYKVHFMESRCFPETSLSYHLKKREQIIDQVIHAFKIGDVIIEPLRTTTQKTFDDFIRCSQLPQNTKICFIDNTYYNKMMRENIFYINVKAFVHYLTMDEIWKRFNFSTFHSEKFIFGFGRASTKTVNVPSLRSNQKMNSERSMGSSQNVTDDEGKIMEWNVNKSNDENSRFLQKQIKRFFENTT
jgi:hypothetical protein